MRRNLVQVTVALVVFSAIAIFLIPRTHRWTEEVELSDGKIITVTRSVEKETLGETPYGGRYRDQQICYERGDLGELCWSGDAFPFAFDRIGQTYYLAVLLQYKAQCAMYDSPNPPFVYFRLDDTSWRRIERRDTPELLKKNLLVQVESRPKGTSGKHISTLEKDQLDTWANRHFQGYRPDADIRDCTF